MLLSGGMTVNPLSNIGQMLLSGITGHRHNSGTASTGSTTTAGADNSQLSPFAQLMTTLQQLQQSNPAEYKQLTATLSSDLQAAAKNAQSNGDADEANALNQLAASFNQASQSGQLPSFMQQSTQAGASGHPHHHHHGALGQDLNSISQNILSNLDPSASGSIAAQS